MIERATAVALLKLSKWLALPVDSSEHLTKSLAEMEMPERLYGASWEEVLLDLVPSWVEKGTELPGLLFAKSQRVTKEEIEKVPSWAEKGTELLSKKIWYVVAILALCSSPVSFSQLIQFFQYKNLHTFRENYLMPLRRLGFLSLTKPDTPNASDNKYVITELGIEFLMGQLN